jgi:hypothetical protein
LKIVSVSDNGIKTIVYKDKDYFYQESDGTLTRVPDEKRKGFRTTIFREPSQTKRPIVQAEQDAYVKKVHERWAKKFPQKSENNND